MFLFQLCSNGNQFLEKYLNWHSFSGLIIPLFNDEILSEYKIVLSRPKFKLSNELVNSIVNEIEEKGLYVNEKTLDEYLPDPKDRVFYEVVMEERNNEDAYLVTGNIKHFPVRPFIVTPRRMLDIILEENF